MMPEILECLKEEIKKELKRDLLKALIQAYIKDMLEEAEQKAPGTRAVIIRIKKGADNVWYLHRY